MSALAPKLSEEATDREIRLIFLAFDRDKDNVISINDLRFVMGITGRAHSAEELDAIMKELDIDGDGVVTRKYFPVASH